MNYKFFRGSGGGGGPGGGGTEGRKTEVCAPGAKNLCYASVHDYTK